MAAVLTEPRNISDYILPKAKLRRKKKKKTQHRLRTTIKQFYENRQTIDSIEKNKVLTPYKEHSMSF